MSSNKVIVNQLMKIIRENDLSYDHFNGLCKIARKDAGLTRPKRVSVQQLPTMDEVQTFFVTVDKFGKVIDKIMMKLLIFTGIRSGELVNMRVSDLDLEPGKEKIYITRKGGDAQYIPIPARMVDVIQLFIQTLASNQVYLFEGRNYRPMTTRALRAKFAKFRKIAGLDKKFHAHNFRHIILTHLAGEGWTNQELMDLSGHNQSSSLDIYVRKNPEAIRAKLNEAIKEML